MIKKEIEINNVTGDKVNKYTLDNGLSLYICNKEGYNSTIGMFGTEYGSIDNEFIDIETGKKEKVPEGIAHFLEHKLFEQEGANALDLFSKMGVSCNAYTSFDHTVYYFETTKKVEESLEKLVELVTTPYFTVENVEKEKGIIMQELKMYEDDPGSVVYYNALKAMYVNHPLNIDIVGTRDSILRITKENLYTCYNTFYSPNNMFFMVVGDVQNADNMAESINTLFSKRENKYANQDITRIKVVEPQEIGTKTIEKKIDIFNSYIAFAFKYLPKKGIENKKIDLIVQIIEEAEFAEMSDFYEKLYNKGVINEPIQFEYGYGVDYSYLMILGCSQKPEEYTNLVKEELKKLKDNGINEDNFIIAKNKIIGKYILRSEKLTDITRQIINSYILKTKIFDDITILKNINLDDVNRFLKENIDLEKIVESQVKPK